MGKKVLAIVAFSMLLSGCTVKLPVAVPGASTGGGSVWKSSDSGETFSSKVVVTVDGAEQKITSADVLNFVFSPSDQQVIYMGTLGSGLFKTIDGAEHWEKLVFPPTKIYGLTIDRSNANLVYASGVISDVGKVYRSEDGGKEWKEVYTEPGAGTVITALGSSPDVPSTIYAGTSAGVIIKSMDGGETWKNVFVAKGPITDLVFHPGLPATVTFLIFSKGTIMSSDGGGTWNDYASLSANASSSSQTGTAVDLTALQPSGITTLVADPSRPGLLYAGGSNGLFKSDNYGESWQALPIIESSRKFPIRSVAISPKNSAEVIYVSGSAFYKSIDRGMTWSTIQLKIDRGVSVIEYTPNASEIIYFGLRKF
ncbi:MAG: hypothetical protein KBD65_01160 [Candidatus Moranbacteria bacterium]|nr:hypothetical protein [Candidatus Moranbacteria bacterium]